MKNKIESDMKVTEIGERPGNARQPLGVMPRDVWIKNRIRDITRALYEYAHDDNVQDSFWYEPIQKNQKKELLVLWTYELKELLEELIRAER